MCTPASLVLTKDNVFWSKKSDRHENIIDEFELHADGTKGPNILRVEIVPQGGDMTIVPTLWKYCVDQDVLPEWADGEADEARARRALSDWIDARLFVGDSHVAVDGDSSVFLYNSSAVLRDNSSADLRDNSSADLWANSSADLWDNSSAVLWANSSAVLWANSSAVLRDNSRAVLRANSSAILRDNSRAILWDRAVARNFTGKQPTLSSREAVVLSYIKDEVCVFTA